MSDIDRNPATGEAWSWQPPKPKPAAILADREKRAQAAQGFFGMKPLPPDVAEILRNTNMVDLYATESKPVQAEAPCKTVVACGNATQCEIEGRCLKVETYPPVQAEAPSRSCNNADCGWEGTTDRMLGSIGPLCPECGETTEPVQAEAPSERGLLIYEGGDHWIGERSKIEAEAPTASNAERSLREALRHAAAVLKSDAGQQTRWATADGVHTLLAALATQQEAQPPTAEEMRPDFEWWWTTRGVLPPLGSREAAAAWSAWIASGGYKAPSDWKLSDAPWAWDWEQEAQPQAEPPDRAFLDRALAAMEGVIDVADRKTVEFDALRSCVLELTLMLHAPTEASKQAEAPNLDAWECSDCGGTGRVTVYHDVTHQLGTDSLLFCEECPTCEGLKFCGPDADKRSALATKQAEAPPPNTTMKRDEWGALSPEAQALMREAVRARTLRAAQGAASIRDVPLLGSEAQGDKFPFSAWETMEHAKRALNAMLTHMGMDEDEWNKPTFEQAKSAVRTLEWQLGRPDQVALWKTRYESIKAPLSKFHQQAVDAGFDGIGDAIAVARRGEG